MESLKECRESGITFIFRIQGFHHFSSASRKHKISVVHIDEFLNAGHLFKPFLSLAVLHSFSKFRNIAVYTAYKFFICLPEPFSLISEYVCIFFSFKHIFSDIKIGTKSRPHCTARSRLSIISIKHQDIHAHSHFGNIIFILTRYEALLFFTDLCIRELFKWNLLLVLNNFILLIRFLQVNFRTSGD